MCYANFSVSYVEEWVSESLVSSDTPLILLAFSLSLTEILHLESVYSGDDCRAIPLPFLGGIATLGNS